MRKGAILGAVTLLGVCLVLGVRYGLRYGWLAGHTHWLTKRRRPSEPPPNRSYLNELPVDEQSIISARATLKAIHL